MDAVRWERILEIGRALLERPETEHTSYLQAACGEDATLQADIESLLRHDAAAGSFLEPPSSGTPTVLLDLERTLLGRRIGAYTTRSVLGRGGMGVVYEAEQDSPRRMVALKVMRTLPCRDDLTARLFRREGQALARLDHPSIAAIHEAGRSDDGLFYFAMELVDGTPLTEHARERDLTMRARLELFRRVCDAVHYAHQRGVIHRDLKPANILVIANPSAAGSGNAKSAIGQPKILDFGLARIIESDVGDTQITRPGDFQGTLAYASPEQACGRTDKIDTRSDVYSLGVILYELLTGSLPHQVSGLSLPDAVRVICDESPQPPSSRIRAAGGDLDTLVLKAMHRDQEQRYASAGTLAADIERFLTNQPILARPPSFVYVARKFVRRYALASTLAAGLLLVILAGTITTTLLTFRFADQRDLARAAERRESEARQSAEKVAAFLEQLFDQGDPFVQATPDPKVRDLVEAGVARLDTDLGDQPMVHARLATVLGKVYRELGDFSKSLVLLEGAVATIRRHRGEAHADLVAPLARLSNTLTEMGMHDKAHEVQLQVLQICVREHGEHGEEVAGAYDELGTSRFYAEDYDAAARYHQRSLEIRRELHGDHGLKVADSLHNLGWVFLYLQRFDEAERALHQALEERQRLADHDAVALTYQALGHVAVARKDLVTAEQYLRSAVEAYRLGHNDQHPRVAEAMNDLAFVIAAHQGDAAAEPWYRQALEIRRATLDATHPDVAASLADLGVLRMRLNDLPEAIMLNKEALAIRRKVLPDDHDLVAGSAHNLAEAYLRAGRLADAEALFLETREIYESNHGPAYDLLTVTLRSLVTLYRSQNRTDETAEYLALLGANLLGQNKRSDAVAPLQEALRLRLQLDGPDDPRTRAIRADLAAAQQQGS